MHVCKIYCNNSSPLHVPYILLIVRFLGGGLLSETDYEKWKPKRQAFDPAFHKRLA